MKPFLTLLLMGFLCACTDRRAVTGMQHWSEVEQKARGFLLDGHSRAFIDSLDMSGATVDERKEFYTFAQKWAGAKLRKHPKEVRIMDPDDYQILLKEQTKDWPSSVVKEMTTWKTEPDKVIYFSFEFKGEESESSRSFGVGVFQRDGLWYFCF